MTAAGQLTFRASTSFTLGADRRGRTSSACVRSACVVQAPEQDNRKSRCANREPGQVSLAVPVRSRLICSPFWKVLAWRSPVVRGRRLTLPIHDRRRPTASLSDSSGGLPVSIRVIYLATRGWIGHRLGWYPSLVLETTGRRSGAARSVRAPVPAPLRRVPRCRIELRWRPPPALVAQPAGWPEGPGAGPPQGFDARAQAVFPGDERYEDLWRTVTRNGHRGPYERYRKQTSRPIPVVRIVGIQALRSSRTLPAPFGSPVARVLRSPEASGNVAPTETRICPDRDRLERSMLGIRQALF